MEELNLINNADVAPAVSQAPMHAPQVIPDNHYARLIHADNPEFSRNRDESEPNVFEDVLKAMEQAAYPGREEFMAHYHFNENDFASKNPTYQRLMINRVLRQRCAPKAQETRDTRFFLVDKGPFSTWLDNITKYVIPDMMKLGL